MNKYFIWSILGLLLVACGHKAKPKSTINVEMLGNWSNDSRCVATFAKIHDNLVLTRFTDGKNNVLKNVFLISKKVSIVTTFKSQNPDINFSGSFLEGVIVIDNYCTEPLHKLGS